MSFTIDKIFTTSTALFSKQYIKEVAPCNLLKPYVRCFWETNFDNQCRELRVIPDCCADILICSVNGKVYSNFCGVSNKSFASKSSVKIFGIRFYAWSVLLFSSANLSGTLNCYIRAENIFDDFSKVAQEVTNSNSMTERIAKVQSYLLTKLQRSRENCDVMNSIYKIIMQSANIDVKDLSNYSAISRRTLERQFRNNTGLSPKEAIELIRYQLLWQESMKSNFNILDSVEKFGYYDSSHLYNDFKRFHGVSLPQALTLL